MTDPVVCAEFTFGAPMASLEALVELRSLLDSTRAHQGAKRYLGEAAIHLSLVAQR